jgi:hypothetical protein
MENTALKMYLDSVFQGSSAERITWTIEKFADFYKECAINEQGKICRDIHSALVEIRLDRRQAEELKAIAESNQPTKEDSWDGDDSQQG